MVVLALAHVRVWLHNFLSGGTQDPFFLMLTKTGTGMALLAVVAPMNLIHVT